jgi:uncharacterized protein (DUF2147 family)
MAIAAPALAQMSPLACGAASTTRPRAQGRDPHHGQRRRAERAHRKDLRKDAKPTCTECQDDRKGKPMVGLEIIRGGKKAEGKDVWEGGKILDPENGKDYRAASRPWTAARSWMRGYLGSFWRTQTWQRVE